MAYPQPPPGSAPYGYNQPGYPGGYPPPAGYPPQFPQGVGGQPAPGGYPAPPQQYPGYYPPHQQQYQQQQYQQAYPSYPSYDQGGGYGAPAYGAAAPYGAPPPAAGWGQAPPPAVGPYGAAPPAQQLPAQGGGWPVQGGVGAGGTVADGAPAQAPAVAPAGQAAYTRIQIESLMERKGSPFQRNTAGFSNQVRSVWAGDAHSLEPATVVALADNGEFHVYDRETWDHLFSWGKHQHQVNWSGNSFWNGTAVVVGGRNLSFCRITGDDKSVKTLSVSAPGLCDGLSVVGLMHHAQQAVVATNEKLGLIDLETGRAIRNIKSDTGSLYSLQAVPNCPGLAVAMLSSGAIKVWDLNTSSDTAIKQFTGLGPHPRGLHFNPTNPNQFIAGSYDKPVRLFDFASGRATHSRAENDGEDTTDYTIVGNAVLRCVKLISEGSSKASLSLVENLDEELNSFTCSRYAEQMNCGLLTPTSAIVFGHLQSVVEFSSSAK